jgi:hypothetical protein
VEQTLAALAAIDRTARFHLGRVACLELSLGAVVTLALTRRYSTLVIGVADDPCRFHAWVCAQETSVPYPADWNAADFRTVFSE